MEVGVISGFHGGCGGQLVWFSVPCFLLFLGFRGFCVGSRGGSGSRSLQVVGWGEDSGVERIFRRADQFSGHVAGVQV